MRFLLSALRAGCAASILMLALAPPALAQRTTFNPQIALFWRYTDNANVVDLGSADDGTSTTTSDSYTNVSATLPVNHRTRFGSLGFSYRASYFKYDQSTQYDNLAHGLDFNIEREFSRGMSLRWDLAGTLSQDQGVPEKIDDQELFLTLRTDRRIYITRLRFEKKGRRDSWDISVYASRAEYEPIDGTLPDTPPNDPTVLTLVPEDRTQVGARLYYTRSLSRRFSIGPRYNAARTELGRNGNETYQLLGLYTGWDVTKYFKVGLTVGMYERSREEDSTAGVTSITETDWYWTADLRIDPPLAAFQKGKLRLGLDVGLQPTGGGALPGTSTNSFVRLYLESGKTKSPWSWQVGSRYTRRDSTLDNQPTFETVGVDASIDRFVGRLVSLRLGADYADQLNQDSGATAASFASARLGVVIYPNRR